MARTTATMLVAVLLIRAPVVVTLIHAAIVPPIVPVTVTPASGNTPGQAE